jgi:drug/metabolite transporter (DMT)-like permease
MPVVPLVLCAAALHATWNALVKPAGDRLAAVGALNVAIALLCLPAAALVTPHRAALPWLALAAALHVVYYLVLVAAYDEGEFGQAYPIARGSAPPLVAIVAAIALGESLNAVRIAGLGLVAAGMFALAAGPRRPRAIALAARVGVVIAAYTVVDGIGVRHAGTPLGYGAWLFVCSGALTALAARLRAGSLRGSRTVVLAGAPCAIAAYGLVLWAQAHGRLAVVAGLRETSVVFGALIGAVAFREALGVRRVAASAVVAAGAVALALG